MFFVSSPACNDLRILIDGGSIEWSLECQFGNLREFNSIRGDNIYILLQVRRQFIDRSLVVPSATATAHVSVYFGGCVPQHWTLGRIQIITQQVTCKAFPRIYNIIIATIIVERKLRRAQSPNLRQRSRLVVRRRSIDRLDLPWTDIENMPKKCKLRRSLFFCWPEIRMNERQRKKNHNNAAEGEYLVIPSNLHVSADRRRRFVAIQYRSILLAMSFSVTD